MPTSIIIGAGITGITVARELKQAGWETILLEKGRGVGGRMATRRIEETVFDHGAQFVSAKSNEFQGVLTELKKSEIANLWNLDATPQFSHPRWKGLRGMSSIPKYLVNDLECKLNQKVIQIKHEDGLVHVQTESGEVFSAEKLILTMPIPQVIDLFENSELIVNQEVMSTLHSVEYLPCIAVLAVLNSLTQIPYPGGLMLENEDVSWLADNFQKGISANHSVTLHASATYSIANFNKDLHNIGKELLSSVSKWVLPESIIDFQVHRWRYSQASKRVTANFLKINHPFEMHIGGDAFGNGNVEGAFLSGKAIAKSLLKIQ